MYFLFVLQRKGIPIYDIFDICIKDLATTRFSPDLDDQYKSIYFQQLKGFMRQRDEDGLETLPFVMQVEKLNQTVVIKRMKYFENEKKRIGEGDGSQGAD